MRYLLLAFFSSCLLFSKALVFQSGYVMAHTSVFGDSSINPKTSNIVSHLKMNGDNLTSIRGKVILSMSALKSNNHKRDEHMYKVIDVTLFPNATYKIISVKKNSAGSYNILGNLTLHGVTKPIKMLADITKNGNSVTISGKSSFNMSSFGIKPPKLLFLTVRDKLDITVNTTYKVK